jgi:transposase
MARNMQFALRISFPNVSLVTDRFHVVKLVLEALQHLRINYRWEVIGNENEELKKVRANGTKYSPEVFANGDTLKQLLTRGRYLLFKRDSDWTSSHQQRADISFIIYPLLKTAYGLATHFRNIYENHNIDNAKKQFKDWINDNNNSNIKEFNTAAKSIEFHLETILNFFNDRNTNANAESFNSKIKLFRAKQKAVRDITFFLFRLQKLFA